MKTVKINIELVLKDFQESSPLYCPDFIYEAIEEKLESGEFISEYLIDQVLHS